MKLSAPWRHAASAAPSRVVDLMPGKIAAAQARYDQDGNEQANIDKEYLRSSLILSADSLDTPRAQLGRYPQVAGELVGSKSVSLVGLPEMKMIERGGRAPLPRWWP